MRKKIQCSTSGHNPEEDALSAMELVLLKLRMGVEYGDIILSGHSNWKVLSQKKIREILEAQVNGSCFPVSFCFSTRHFE